MSGYESDEDKLYKCQNSKCNKDVILYNRCYYCDILICRDCAKKKNWVHCNSCCYVSFCRKCMRNRKCRTICSSCGGKTNKIG